MAHASPYIYATCPKCLERVVAMRIGGVVTLKPHAHLRTFLRCDGSNQRVTSPQLTEGA